MRSLYHLLILISSGLFFTNTPLSAQIVQDDRKIKSFENIVISASENTYVHISYDKSHKITVKADGRNVHKVRTTVSGDTLNVHLNPEELGNARVEIYIRVPKVKKVTIAGSGVVDIVDGIGPGDLQTTLVDYGFSCS
ncbi:MAG TPA: DUF2807 domain-containing protein [Chryseolinea sp.]|nr:DUF2807 domain-containing protein [Chryseolinea sp.]